MTDPGTLLRQSRDADVPAIAAIYAHHVLNGLASFEEVPPDPCEVARRRLAIVAEGLPHLVAETGGRVVGFAYAGRYRPRSAYRYTLEDSVYVAPDAVGRGIGGGLLAAVIAAAEATGCRQMVAVIGDSGNTPSIRLHERAGFVEVGTFKGVGYKFGRWVDSVLMQRPLGPGARTPPDPVADALSDAARPLAQRPPGG